jgi:hypothetical protein
LLLHAIFRAKGTRCCLQKRRLLRENIRAAKRIIGNTLALQTAMWLEKLTRDFGFSIRQNQAIVRASLRGPVRRRPLVAQHTRHVFRSPGNDGPAERMDRTSCAAQLELTASGIASRMLGTHIKGQRMFIRCPLAWSPPPRYSAMQTRLVVHENLRAGSDEHTTPNLRAAGNVRPRIDNAAFADPHFVTQRATEVAQRESIENNVHSANHPEQTSAPFPIRAVSKPMRGTRIGSLLFSASVAFGNRFTVPLGAPRPCALRSSAGRDSAPG